MVAKIEDEPIVEPIFRTFHRLHQQQSAFYHPIESKYRYQDASVHKIADIIAVGSRYEPEAILSLLQLSQRITRNRRQTYELYIADQEAIEAMGDENSPSIIQQKRLGVLSVQKAGATLFPLDSLKDEHDDTFFPDLRIDVGIEKCGGVIVRDRTERGTWIHADWEKVGRVSLGGLIMQQDVIPETGAEIIKFLPRQRNA